MKALAIMLLVGLAWPASTPPEIHRNCSNCVRRCSRALDPLGCRSMCYYLKGMACMDQHKGPGPDKACSCT